MGRSRKKSINQKPIKRCAWVDDSKLYQNYHDTEWGVPVRDDQTLFEFLILEGAQAGLSWITILKKREGYKALFKGFDVQKCAKLEDKYLEECLHNPSIIRNRLKVFSVRSNALAFIEVQKEFGHFSDYLWGFVDNQPIVNNWQTISEVPASTPLSDAIAKDLKKRGFKFVGTTIVYAYLQAVGIVNDHTTDCFCHSS